MAELDDLDAQLLAQMREDFLAESQEILERLGPLLTELEKSGNPEVINTIFREVHTLKGAAGFIGLESIRLAAHKLEDLFGVLRSEQLKVSPELIDIAFAGVQLLATMREEVVRSGGGGFASGSEGDPASLIARVEAALRGEELPPVSVAPGGVGSSVSVMSASTETTLRVDIETLDTLMTLVGELITARNALLIMAEQLRNEQLQANVDTISRITRQLQDAVTAVRLVPVDRLFNRFTGVVRNMARERGKMVRLVIEGGDTPLDRAVSEQMYDPLIHLLRNAVDHGLEPTPDRRRAGKPEEGTIRLSAERRGDDVILRVSDDGSGIDPDRLRRVAVQRGLYSAEEVAALSNERAIRLIFAPAFSTASRITDTSGRGVGMDVVMQNVRQLRGSVDIETVVGRGTTFVIQLPLTLAILQVLLVRVDGYTYALPLHIVRETLQLSPGSIQSMQQGEVVFIRQVALPVRRLSDCGLLAGFGAEDPKSETCPEPCRRIQYPKSLDGLKPAIVVHLPRGDEVFVVDELLGKQQVVVKPLSQYLGTLQGVEGAAILPDGSVTLILDLDRLARGDGVL